MQQKTFSTLDRNDGVNFFLGLLVVCCTLLPQDFTELLEGWHRPETCRIPRLAAILLSCYCFAQNIRYHPRGMEDGETDADE